MALINRVSRLFKADFHAVLDQLEEPEQMLRQAIRDMEDELAASEQLLAERALEQESLLARSANLQSVIEEADNELDLCFDSGKEDLAKGLVRKKLEAGKLIRFLDDSIEANDQFIVGQKKALEENTTALESLRQKAEVFATRSKTTLANGRIDETAFGGRHLAVGDDEIEIAFLREKTQRSAS